MNEEILIEFYGENSYNNVATEINYIDIVKSGKEVKLEVMTQCRMDEEYESINECSLIVIKYWLKKTLIYQRGNELGSFSGSVQNH